MDRQYVHLSLDERTAEVVGSRKDGKLVILKVNAKEAFLNDVQFLKKRMVFGSQTQYLQNI